METHENGGGIAGKKNTGKLGENAIASLLNDRGIAFENRHKIGYKNNRGGNIEVDFYIYPTVAFPDGLIIESKRQDVKGTADEKFDFLVSNILECYPLPTIIIEVGMGARKNAKEWLRLQADGIKLVAVMGLDGLVEFLTTHDMRPAAGAQQLLL